MGYFGLRRGSLMIIPIILVRTSGRHVRDLRLNLDPNRDAVVSDTPDKSKVSISSLQKFHQHG